MLTCGRHLFRSSNRLLFTDLKPTNSNSNSSNQTLKNKKWSNARDGKMMSKHVSLDYSIQNVKMAIVIMV